MWTVKVFRFRTLDAAGMAAAAARRDAWIAKHQHTHRIREIVVNNAYGLDVCPIKVVR